MKTINTIKEVLTEMESMVNIVERGIHGHYFLCCIPHTLFITGKITRVLSEKTKDYIEAEKPEVIINNSFYNYKHYTKDSSTGLAWWEIEFVEEGEKQLVVEEKIRFLQHIKGKL